MCVCVCLCPDLLCSKAFSSPHVHVTKYRLHPWAERRIDRLFWTRDVFFSSLKLSDTRDQWTHQQSSWRMDITWPGSENQQQIIRGGKNLGSAHGPAPWCVRGGSAAERWDWVYLCGPPHWKTQMGYPCSRSLSFKAHGRGLAFQAAFQHLYNLGLLSPSFFSPSTESTRFASLRLSFRQWGEWQ